MTTPRADQRLSRPGGPWSTGGFGNWLLGRYVGLCLVLLLMACSIGMLLPVSLGSGRHPHLSLTILRDTSGHITATASSTETETTVGRVDWFTSRNPVGLPAAFLEREHHALLIQVSDPNVLQSQCRAAVAHFLDQHPNGSSPSNYAFSKYSARIAAGDFDIVSLSPSGIAIDALTLFAALAFIFWIATDIQRAYRHSSRIARRASGLCPTCGYDTLDLTADLCPECGARLDPIPPDNATL